MTNVSDAILHPATPIEPNDPELQERADLFWRVFHAAENHEHLMIALLRCESLRSGIAAQELTQTVQSSLARNIAELAYDHLSAERQDAANPPPEATGPNVMAWLSESFFGDAAKDIMANAALEIEMVALKKRPEYAGVQDDAKAVIRKLTREDIITLLDVIKEPYRHYWPVETEDDKKQLNTQAVLVLSHKVEKALSEGRTFGDTSSEIAQNVARELVENGPELNEVLRKLMLNIKAQHLAGGKAFDASYFGEAAWEQARVGYSELPQNAPRSPVVTPEQDGRPFAERPGNRQGERSDRQVG